MVKNQCISKQGLNSGSNGTPWAIIFEDKVWTFTRRLVNVTLQSFGSEYMLEHDGELLRRMKFYGQLEMDATNKGHWCYHPHWYKLKGTTTLPSPSINEFMKQNWLTLKPYIQLNFHI